MRPTLTAMRPPFPDSPVLPAPPAGVVLQFLAAALLAGAVAALAARVLMPGAGVWAAAGPAVMLGAVAMQGARALRSGHRHARLGGGNLVTLARAGVVAVLAVALLLPSGVANDPALAWTLAALAAAGLVLDGLDGWLARRSRLTSAFGARFDMEVDAALAAVLCLLAILSGKAGPWLIPLGFLRYGWVAAAHLLPWLDGPLPDRFSRKAVCVVQVAALIALTAPVVVPPVSTGMATLATLALVWSFGIDALWRWRHRA